MVNNRSIKELINSLIKLNSKSKEDDDLVIRKLFVGHITPEWYYSDIYRLEFNSTDWKDLKNQDFIKDWIKNFNLEKIIDYEDKFEKSFSSWYQPYHFFFEKKWGIHIRLDVIMRIAKKFFKYCPNTKNNISESVKASFLYVYFHHQYHNIIENSVTIMEIKYNTPNNIYQKYYSNIYSKTLHSSICLEELLANKYMINKMIEFNIDKEFLINELHHLQQSYADYQDNIMYLLEEKLIKQMYNNLDYDVNISNMEDNCQNEIPIWLRSNPKPLH